MHRLARTQVFKDKEPRKMGSSFPCQTCFASIMLILRPSVALICTHFSVHTGPLQYKPKCSQTQLSVFPLPCPSYCHIQLLGAAGPRPEGSLPPFLSGVLLTGSFNFCSGSCCLFGCRSLELSAREPGASWSREWLQLPSGNL